MAFGATTLGLAALVLVVWWIAEARARHRQPRRVCVVRPVGEASWTIGVDELAAAARSAGLAVRRRRGGFALPCAGLGRRLDVERAVPDELGWVIWSSSTHATAALLRAFAAQFGALAISIPLEHSFVAAHVYPLDHERMTIVVDGRLATDTLADLLDAAHADLVVEIERCLRLRIEILDLLLASMSDRESPNAGPTSV